MCDGWTASTLSEVITLQRGFDLPLQDRRPGLVPILGSFGVTGRHDFAPVNGPGVTIGRSGNIGTAAYTDTDYWPLNTTLFVRDFHGNEPRFVYYLLKTINFTAYNSGSVQPSLNRNYIARIPVNLPPRVEQRAIAEVLGALDEKIDSNTIIAHRADELWYCEQSRVLNQWDIGNDAAFPTGWSRAPLSSLARFVNGRNFTKGATGSGRMVVRIAELNSGPGRSTVYNTIEVSDDHVVRPRDLLFAWSGSLTVQRWFRAEAIVNQHIFKVIPAPTIPLWMVHGYLLQLLPWYRQIAADKATTMGHIQRRHLDAPVILPDAWTREKLEERCAPLWNRALTAERESLVLAELRDGLLPHLVSGEIRVREAEELVGDAV